MIIKKVVMKKDCDNKVVVLIRLLWVISEFFFTKRFYAQKSVQNAKKQLLSRCLRLKSNKKQTRNFYS